MPEQRTNNTKLILIVDDSEEMRVLLDLKLLTFTLTFTKKAKCARMKI